MFNRKIVCPDNGLIAGFVMINRKIVWDALSATQTFLHYLLYM